MGGAIFVAAAQSLFSNRLISSLYKNVPEIDPATIISTGATELKSNFGGSQLSGILQSYMTGLRAVWILGVAIAGTAVLISLTPGWKNIRYKTVEVIDNEVDEKIGS